MYQQHKSLANLSLELGEAILSNCVFFMRGEYTQEEVDPPLAISRLDNNRNRSTILFSSALVARKAAYLLRGEWIGSTLSFFTTLMQRQ